MIETNSNKQVECIVYLETFYRLNSGCVDAYIDFRQDKDLRLFRTTTNFDIENATIIELKSLKIKKN